ncbi:MAG TPA: gephyrin-like molybdotransferase Glp [Terriglobales bacterium]|nr:gephyrin-like molybdotransferase Glp [Terriglobales bacterium]
MPELTKAVAADLGALSFVAARHQVEEHAALVGHPAATELCDLLQARGRVLAEEVRADRDQPPFPRATRDGYAVRSADLAQVPARLRVIGEIRAGASTDSASLTLQEGEAAEIMTGAPAPQGADAVVMVEYTRRNGSQVEIERSVACGENIVPVGAEARRGDSLLKPGTRMTPAAIAVAASVGKSQLRVFPRPRIAILATGDEIVDVAANPNANQIHNSNSYSLAAQVEGSGGIPLLLPIAADEHSLLREQVEKGLQADLLLLTGGVSMGKYDLVEQVLRELGAEFIFTGAEIQPGRPVVFGRVAAKAKPVTYFFGLPGNPVSTMVTFELFARPMIDALAGTPPARLRFLKARLKADVKVRTGLTRFLPALLTGEFGDCKVEQLRWQGSGDIVTTARGNCFLVVPPDREIIPAGELVSVMLSS